MMSTNNNIVVTKKFFCRANYANASMIMMSVILTKSDRTT